ncbi:hypothetical protein SNEBB_002906 [Seison nebaliae]|nr:hypothetical protein SNEBB_002906 [Seison nebaliae]
MSSTLPIVNTSEMIDDHYDDESIKIATRQTLSTSASLDIPLHDLNVITNLESLNNNLIDDLSQNQKSLSSALNASLTTTKQSTELYGSGISKICEEARNRASQQKTLIEKCHELNEICKSTLPNISSQIHQLNHIYNSFVRQQPK